MIDKGNRKIAKQSGDRKNDRRRFLRTMSTAFIGWPCIAMADRLVGDMTPETLKQRGEELLAVLKEKYASLQQHRALQGGLCGTDVTNVVLQYIPIGTPFSEAEEILQNAGCVISAHPNPNPPPDPNRPKDWYAVIAKISPFRRIFPSKVDFYVSLLPPSPGDYKTVSGLSATFLVSSP